MTATAAIGVILAGGLHAISAVLAPATLLAVACIGVSLAVIRVLRRRTRITHLVLLPPAEEGEPVIDDALPLLFEHRPAEAGSVTEALRQMEAEWNKKQEKRR